MGLVIGDVEVETLTRALAAREGEEIVRLGEDHARDDWTPEHLLADRAGKWELSLLGRRQGRPVAYAVASLGDDSVHVHHMMVAAELRGHGVGAELFRELARRARAFGRPALTLKVYPENTGGIRLYERLGFAKTGVSPGGLVLMRGPVGAVIGDAA